MTTDEFIAPPPPPPSASPTPKADVSKVVVDPYTEPLVPGGRTKLGNLIPRGISPNNFEISRRYAEECGVHWDESMSEYACGGPLWAPPRDQDEYPYVEGVPVCGDCGRQHVTLTGKRSCNAHRKIPGGKIPCRKVPMRETTICATHGAKSGAMVKRRNRRLAEKEAAKSLSKVKVKPIGNPIDELAQMASEAVALKDHFANVVAQLKDQYRFVDDKGAEQLDARVVLYERAMDRSQRFLNDLVKIGFEERRVRLDERRATVVKEFILGVLGELDLDPNDPRVRGAIESWLPILDGEPRAALDVEEVDDDGDEEEPNED